MPRMPEYPRGQREPFLAPSWAAEPLDLVAATAKFVVENRSPRRFSRYTQPSKTTTSFSFGRPVAPVQSRDPGRLPGGELPPGSQADAPSAPPP